MHLKNILSTSLILALIAITSGCGTMRSTSSKEILQPYTVNRAVFMLPMKFYKQEKDKCGVTALKTVLEYYGVDYTDVESIYNKELKATKLISIVNYANTYLDTRVHHLSYENITETIRLGDPIIILMKNNEGNHYIVVKGFIKGERKLIINDGYDENVILSYDMSESKASDGIAIIFNEKSNGEVISRKKNIFNMD